MFGEVAVMTSEISLKLIHELARRKDCRDFPDRAPVRGYMSNLRIDYFSGVEQIVKYLYENGHRENWLYRWAGRGSSPQCPAWRPTKNACGIWDLEPDRSAR